MSNVEVLITTVNTFDVKELLCRMNITTQACIGNQKKEKFDYSEFLYKNNLIKSFDFPEKGVGLNRNNLLMRASAKYCLFGDDDLVYVDGYEEIVEKSFEKYPNADVIIFNLKDENKRYRIKRDFKVRKYNYMRFGAARIAIRLSSIQFNNIYFNVLFGGGTKFSHGEDTVFLKDCLDAHLKIYAVTEEIAKLTDSDSTWFNGYTEKLLQDKGVLFYRLSSHFYRFIFLYQSSKLVKYYNKSIIQLYKNMKIGLKKYLESNKK